MWPALTLQAIDQIWDDYTRHNPRAKAYMRYLPTTPAMLEEAEYQVRHGGADSLDDWLNKLQRRERGME